jgi:hypothetical protein
MNQSLLLSRSSSENDSNINKQQRRASRNAKLNIDSNTNNGNTHASPDGLRTGTGNKKKWNRELWRVMI